MAVVVCRGFERGSLAPSLRREGLDSRWTKRGEAKGSCDSCQDGRNGTVHRGWERGKGGLSYGIVERGRGRVLVLYGTALEVSWCETKCHQAKIKREGNGDKAKGPERKLYGERIHHGCVVARSRISSGISTGPGKRAGGWVGRSALDLLVSFGTFSPAGEIGPEGCQPAKSPLLRFCQWRRGLKASCFILPVAKRLEWLCHCVSGDTVGTVLILLLARCHSGPSGLTSGRRECFPRRFNALNDRCSYHCQGQSCVSWAEHLNAGLNYSIG